MGTLTPSPPRSLLPVEKALICRDSPQFEMKVPDMFHGKPYMFQLRGAAYGFFMRKYLEADPTGSGKTIHYILLNCLQKMQRLLNCHVQVVLAQSIYQWYGEYRKFAPDLRVRVATGEKADRVTQYSCDFDVLLVSYHILQRDWEYIHMIPYNSIGMDEAGFFKNPETRTFDIVRHLCKNRDYVVPATATPIQNTAVDLWSIFQSLDMEGLLGTRAYFENRYLIKQDEITYMNGRKKTINKTVGYRNLQELKQRINPFYIRRTLEEIDQELPDVVGYDGETPPEPIWLHLLPEQQQLYNDIRNEVLVNNYRGTQLRNRFHLLRKIVGGLRTLDSHNPDISVKADWVMDRLTNDMQEEKVIIFCWYKASIYNLQNRLRERGIDHAVMSSDVPIRERTVTQSRFDNDPNFRVIIGTTALEMSLNLQASRYLICYDYIYNPARMIQVLGRIRRLNSRHHTNVLCGLQIKGTIEEKLYRLLPQRQALSDFVWNEKSDVFEQLNDDELLSIIRS